MCRIIIIIIMTGYKYVNFVCGLMAISHRLPSSSPAAAVLVRRCPCRPPECQKSAPPHSTRYIIRFPAQNLSANYPLQHPHICILPLATLKHQCVTCKQL